MGLLARLATLIGTLTVIVGAVAFWYDHTSAQTLVNAGVEAQFLVAENTSQQRFERLEAQAVEVGAWVKRQVRQQELAAARREERAIAEAAALEASRVALAERVALCESFGLAHDECVERVR